MNSLRKVGDDMKAEQGVNDRVVFLISDMLEHSDYTSFYATNKIKQLNVGDELKQAKSRGCLPICKALASTSRAPGW